MMWSKSLLVNIFLLSTTSFVVGTNEHVEGSFRSLDKNNGDFTLDNSNGNENAAFTRVTRADTTAQTKRQKQISKNLEKAEDELKKLNLDLALITTKLEQLKTQETTSSSSTSTTTALTKKQTQLAKEVNKAEEKKQDLTLKAALATTLIEQLKKQQSSTTSNTGETTGLTSKQKALIKNIDQAQEKKEDLELKAAVASTLVEQLKTQQSTATSSTDTSSSSSTELTKKQKTLAKEINKAEVKKQELDLKLAMATTLLEHLKKQESSTSSSTSD